MNRPKQIGTKGESDIVRWVRPRGFSGAERLALHGTHDEGDGTLCPGVGFESKAGKAAERASDRQIAKWCAEAETERFNRNADVMLLVVKRAGKGALSAGQWSVYLPGRTFAWLATVVGKYTGAADYLPGLPEVRITLDEALILLRGAGYGDTLEVQATIKKGTE